MEQAAKPKRDIKDLLGKIYFTNNYPELRKAPIQLYKAYKIYDDLANRDLDLYYNRLKNYPTDLQKEIHRHTATAAVLSQLYPDEFVRQLGNLKEYSDLQTGQSNSNSVFDLKNNENGIKIGKQYPNLSRTQIYDVILNQLRGDTERELYWQNQPHIYKNVYGEIYSQK